MCHVQLSSEALIIDYTVIESSCEFKVIRVSHCLSVCNQLNYEFKLAGNKKTNTLR